MMISVFLTLLFLSTFISLLLYLRTNQDIHLVLAFFCGTIFLIWSLVVAHWSIHLLSLLVLLCLRIPFSNPKTVEIYEES